MYKINNSLLCTRLYVCHWLLLYYCLNPVFQFNSGSILFWQFQIKHTIEEKMKQRYITLNSQFVFVFVVFFFLSLIFLVLFVWFFFLHTCHLKKIINQSTSNNIFEKIVTFFFCQVSVFCPRAKNICKLILTSQTCRCFSTHVHTCNCYVHSKGYFKT